MFSVGLGELFVIAFVAVLVLGPDRLPGLAKQAATLAHRLKGMATSARDEIRSELGPEYAHLEIGDLDPRAFIRKQIAEAMAEVEAEQKQGREDSQALLPGQLPPYDSEAT